jgi:hypothetical protein
MYNFKKIPFRQQQVCSMWIRSLMDTTNLFEFNPKIIVKTPLLLYRRSVSFWSFCRICLLVSILLKKHYNGIVSLTIIIAQAYYINFKCSCIVAIFSLTQKNSSAF